MRLWQWQCACGENGRWVAFRTAEEGGWQHIGKELPGNHEFTVAAASEVEGRSGQ